MHDARGMNVIELLVILIIFSFLLLAVFQVLSIPRRILHIARPLEKHLSSIERITYWEVRDFLSARHNAREYSLSGIEGPYDLISQDLSCGWLWIIPLSNSFLMHNKEQNGAKLERYSYAHENPIVDCPVLLAFTSENHVLGILKGTWENNFSFQTTDFIPLEETSQALPVLFHAMCTDYVEYGLFSSTSTTSWVRRYHGHSMGIVREMTSCTCIDGNENISHPHCRLPSFRGNQKMCLLTPFQNL